MNKTKFIYNEDGKPIGRVDRHGNIYTMALKPSYPHYNTPAGVAVNKAHAAREAAALDVTFDPEFDPTDIFED